VTPSVYTLELARHVSVIPRPACRSARKPSPDYRKLRMRLPIDEDDDSDGAQADAEVAGPRVHVKVKGRPRRRARRQLGVPLPGQDVWHVLR